MKRIFSLLLILTVVSVSIVFGSLNFTPVDVDFFFFPVTGKPLALWLLGFFAAGMLVAGVLVYLQLWFSLRRRLREVKAQSAAEQGGASVPAVVNAETAENE